MTSPRDWCLTCHSEAQAECIPYHRTVCEPGSGWYSCTCYDCREVTKQMLGTTRQSAEGQPFSEQRSVPLPPKPPRLVRGPEKADAGRACWHHLSPDQRVGMFAEPDPCEVSATRQSGEAQR